MRKLSAPLGRWPRPNKVRPAPRPRSPRRKPTFSPTRPGWWFGPSKRALTGPRRPKPSPKNSLTKSAQSSNREAEMAYQITLQSEFYGEEIMSRDTLDEALAAVKSILETVRDEDLEDSGVHHRQVIIETADCA
jgi:hypothetical protein